MLPRYLQLGNHTVDVNTLFKVPQSDDLPQRSTHEDRRRISITGVSEGPRLEDFEETVVPEQKQNVKHTGSGTGQFPWMRPRTQHEHDRRHGPHFEDESSDNSSVTVQLGHTTHLDCRVSFLRDKTVSWLRRRPGEAPRLLTVGAHTYTGDPRYTVQFRYPGNWRLQLTNANKSDEGLYECQLSTHPPSVIRVYLSVNAPEVTIVDEAGRPLREQYYEAESTLSLRCTVRGEGAGPPIWWLHGLRPLHMDTRRGGVSVRTERLPGGGGADSHLRLSKLTPTDAGNYTCVLPHRHTYTVLVHVLNEESLAELQQGSSTCGPPTFTGLALAVLFALLACS
ncbi:zwei Ig domain protein zig-8-like [Arctopsyche grandis]|uniref:zwei Ig domain protein zig-8-like n=1 Tax=Arctopsyche grandis TaxID=121162 RepID=UPI00406D7DF5